MITPVLIPAVLYAHPDGFKIQCSHNALSVIDDEGNILMVPIGNYHMQDVAVKLYRFAEQMGNPD